MRIAFAGTPIAAVPTLTALLASDHEVALVVTRPDAPAGRGRTLTASPVAEVAGVSGVPVLKTSHLAEHKDKFADVDCVVVVAFGAMVPRELLDVPKHGWINVHFSLLPRWRGAAPIQRALMAGDEKTGVTIMQIVHKLDAGDMLHKEEYVIDSRDTASDLHDKLAKLGATGLSKVLAGLVAGQVLIEAQDECLVTYAEKLSKNEAMIDWSQTANKLELKVRGLNSWPVAQTIYQDKVLRIWQAQALATEIDLDPGRVSCTNKNMDVATGKGVLRLHEVQLPGGKRMSSQAFLNAHDIDGVKLG